MGSSCDPVRSGVICFKLSYESQWTASIDWPVIGQGHTCIYVNASCRIFKPLLLILGEMNQTIPSFPTTRPSFIPLMNPC